MAAYAGVPLFFFTVIGSVMRYLRWITTEFVLTTDRLIVRHGIIGKNGKEIPLDRIMNISFHQSVLERILKTGDLVVESAGEQSQQVFSNVARPEKMQNKIYSAVDNVLGHAPPNRAHPDGMGRTRQFHQPPSNSPRNGPPPPRRPRPNMPPDQRRPTISIADEIAKLANLRNQGTISDDEFEEAKRDLIAKY